jgi:protein-S-isoprenylcysteine O-methyltransferase Ste14
MLQVVLVPALWIWQHRALFLRHLFCGALRYVQWVVCTCLLLCCCCFTAAVTQQALACHAVHLQQRDEHACKRKYGADWDKYQAIVKYRLIPFVY